MKIFGAYHQQFLFMILLIISGVLANWGYREIRGEYIVLSKAEKLFRAGNYEASIPLFSLASQMGLDNKLINKSLADAYLAIEDFSKALPLYQKIVLSSPENIGLKLKYAEILTLDGQINESTMVLKNILKLEPKTTEAWLWLAKNQNSLNDFNDAKNAFEQVLKLDPQSFEALVGLGDVSAWKGQYSEAISLYSEALNLQPENFTLQIKLARVMGWSGDFKKAIKQYQKALDDKP